MKKTMLFKILAVLLAMSGAILLVFTYYPIINPIQYRIDSHGETVQARRLLVGTPVSLMILSGAWYFNRKTRKLKSDFGERTGGIKSLGR
jgi:predicted Co/Zn/Cd cation transporter (cation efflux family)